MTSSPFSLTYNVLYQPDQYLERRWFQYLKKQRERSRGEPWLAGDRVTYADVAFIPYQLAVNKILHDELKPYGLEQFTEASDG